MFKKVVIVAVNYRQASVYAHTHDLRQGQWMYAYKAERMMGLDNVDIVTLDGWENLEEYEELKLRIEMIRARAAFAGNSIGD